MSRAAERVLLSMAMPIPDGGQMRADIPRKYRPDAKARLDYARHVWAATLAALYFLEQKLSKRAPEITHPFMTIPTEDLVPAYVGLKRDYPAVILNIGCAPTDSPIRSLSFEALVAGSEVTTSDFNPLTEVALWKLLLCVPGPMLRLLVEMMRPMLNRDLSEAERPAADGESPDAKFRDWWTLRDSELPGFAFQIYGTERRLLLALLRGEALPQPRVARTPHRKRKA